MTTDDANYTTVGSVERNNINTRHGGYDATKELAELHRSGFLQEIQDPSEKMVLPLKDALIRARSLPGRPPTDILIKQIMSSLSMTRAQAKAHMKKLDLITAKKLQVMEQGDHVVNNVSRITTAVSGALHTRR